jgi:DNA repair exonuclease SbcCD nuclease subunit
MKFVHIADIHLDAPFTLLSDKLNIGEQRRIEQCMAFKKVIEYIKTNMVDYLLISGDLYESEYIKKSTLEYINSLFAEIPNTKIIISPGNHDPFIKDSPYDLFSFEPNVYVFKSDEIEVIEEQDVNIYGSAFIDFYRANNPLESIKILDNGKPNFLVLHCDLNGAKNQNDLSYLPIPESYFKSLKFDYCALGHIHKKYISNNNRIVYPGSLISFGFDELGEHGMIVGELTGNIVNTQFIKIDNREFVEENIDVELFNSQMEIIDYINNYKFNKLNLYKIILIGKRDYELNIKDIKSGIIHENILQIKDLTKKNYNIESIMNENNLRGAFVKRVMGLQERQIITQEEMDKILEIGINAME